MSALLILFVCLLLGVLCRRFANLPPGIVPGINWWVLNVALPALVLELVPKVHFDPALWLPVAAAWIVFFGAWGLCAMLGRALGWSRGRIGCLALVCGLGNTSFMGYPLIEALHGKAGLGIAVINDQMGTFPLLAAGGIVVASLYSGRKPTAALMLRRILTFPAFLALVIGTAAGFAGGWPAWVDDVLAQIGRTLTPLALFSVGLQFRLQWQRDQWPAFGAGLAWKLLLAPAIVFGLGVAAGIGGLILVVSVLQAAMAPMISAALLADQYELEPELANTLLGAGIVVSLATIPLANVLLRGYL
jgi:predicted permease